MKRFVLLLVSLSVFRVATLLAANDVGSFYVVLKEKRYNQTDNSGPILKNDQPYRLETHISQASGGIVTGGTVTPPATGSVHTAQSLAAQNDGLGSWGFEQQLASLPALNAAFGDGLYSVHITGANGTYNSQLTLSGEMYPAEVPQLSNTNFSDGVLVIDPTKPFMATWNSFADHGANDVIVFEVSASNDGPTLLQQILAPDATSQLIPANLLDPEGSYRISLIFLKASDVKTASVPGSTGVAGYALNTRIQVSPAPVPTLFASINGTAQNSGGSIFQYTPAGDESAFGSDLDRPRGLAFNSAGDLFVATNQLDGNLEYQATILKIARDGTLTIFASGFPSNFFIGAIATDRAGNLFAVAGDISDDPNFASTVYKFTPAGVGTTFASLPTQCFGLAFDSTGNLYLADGGNLTIYKFTPNGTQSVFAGPTAFSAGQGPIGLAFDKFGNLFASTEGNDGNDTVLKFTPNATVSMFTSGLNHPRGLSFDSDGNLFVAEISLTGPGNILEFDPAGTGTVFASDLGRPQGNGGPECFASNEFPVIIGSNQTVLATVGQPFVYQITATNHPGFYGAGGLPPGLSVDESEGLIYGLPNQAGNFNVTLSAWNPCGTGLANISIAVQRAPSGLQIISSTSATGRTGQPFQFQVLTSGGTSAARISAMPLPAGLNLDPVTGLISGTPTGDGTFSVTLTLTDGSSSTTAVLQLTFTSDPDLPVITSSDTALLAPGQFFSRQLTADANASFSYIGSDGVKHEGPSSAGLPPGLTFDGVNVISGTYNPPNGDARGVSVTGGPSARVSVENHSIHPYTITIRPRLISSCQFVAANDEGTTSAPLNFLEGSSNITASQPPDITTEATGANGAMVNFTLPTATDGNGGPLAVTCSPASGSAFPVGLTTVACTSAPDGFGAYAIVTFSVTVQDTTTPVITAMPMSVTIAAQKGSKKQPSTGGTVDFASQLSASDTVDGTFTPTATPSSGSFFPLGTTMVTVIAKDKHGNASAPRTFPVTVNTKVSKAKPATVTVSVSPPSLSEGASATFTISASAANPSQATVVHYSMSGMATPANNFYTLSGTPNQVTIPSGASSATVTLNALSNSLSTGSETVIMTIGSGAGYKVKKAPGATVTINNAP